MTGFVMRPRIFPPIQGELDDTKLSCKRVSTYKYVHGQARPNYPVPAIPRRVSFGSWFTMMQDATTLAVYLFVSKHTRKVFIRSSHPRQSRYHNS